MLVEFYKKYPADMDQISIMNYLEEIFTFQEIKKPELEDWENALKHCWLTLVSEKHINLDCIQWSDADIRNNIGFAWKLLADGYAQKVLTTDCYTLKRIINETQILLPGAKNQVIKKYGKLLLINDEIDNINYDGTIAIYTMEDILNHSLPFYITAGFNDLHTIYIHELTRNKYINSWDNYIFHKQKSGKILITSSSLGWVTLNKQLEDIKTKYPHYNELYSSIKEIQSNIASMYFDKDKK